MTNKWKPPQKRNDMYVMNLYFLEGAFWSRASHDGTTKVAFLMSHEKLRVLENKASHQRPTEVAFLFTTKVVF
jgi:hypothetical protein